MVVQVSWGEGRSGSAFGQASPPTFALRPRCARSARIFSRRDCQPTITGSLLQHVSATPGFMQ
eukprot:1830847-Lingulodinium_polyedra.AAC.1